MTSDAFVYLMLPGTTQFVTAGRVVLTTDPLGITAGRFVYGRRYLAREDAVPIDPLRYRGTSEHRKRTFIRHRDRASEWL